MVYVCRLDRHTVPVIFLSVNAESRPSSVYKPPRGAAHRWSHASFENLLHVNARLARVILLTGEGMVSRGSTTSIAWSFVRWTGPQYEFGRLRSRS